MGIEYRYSTGYGFLLPEDKFALPAEWRDVVQWYDGTVDEAISGSGVKCVYGGNNWSGPKLWGFVAAESCASMSRDSQDVVPVRDVDPVVFSNLFEIRTRVKRPKARIGWVMWKDTF